MTHATTEQVAEYLYGLEDALVWDPSADEYTPLLREDARRIAEALSKRFRFSEHPVKKGAAAGGAVFIDCTVEYQGKKPIPNPYEEDAPDPFIGKKFRGGRAGARRRTLTVARVSKNQMRAGQPAKSTVYDCIEYKGTPYERVTRIQAHILATKWREI